MAFFLIQSSSWKKRISKGLLLASQFCESYVNVLGKFSLTKSAEIRYLKKVELNDTIFAECKQNQKNSSLFTVNIFNQKKEEIAIFKGIAHFTSKDWI